MLEDRATTLATLNRLESTEMEQVLLAAAFHENRVIDRVRFVRSDDFAYPLHQEIWDLALTMRERGEAVNPPMLAKVMEGSEKYLAEVYNTFAGTLVAESYAESIRDYANRRRLVVLAERTIERVTDLETPGDEVIATTIGDLQRLAGDGVRRSATKREVGEAIYDDLQTELPCFSTGIRGLDGVMGGGMFAGKLYGIAARKKVGKTILLGTISHNLNRAGVPHLFIAMEMSPKEIEQRNAAREGGFNSVAFLKRDDQNLSAKVADYVATQPDNTVFEHSPGASLDDIRAMIGRAIATRNVKGVILDYLQLVGGKSPRDTEEYHLRTVAQWLADIARREGIFVLVAAQVNQDGNTRGGEGLRLACDQYFALHREKDSQAAWLEMGESRYTMYQNLGGEFDPGLLLNGNGPHFVGAHR